MLETFLKFLAKVWEANKHMKAESVVNDEKLIVVYNLKNSNLGPISDGTRSYELREDGVWLDGPSGSRRIRGRTVFFNGKSMKVSRLIGYMLGLKDPFTVSAGLLVKLTDKELQLINSDVDDTIILFEDNIKRVIVIIEKDRLASKKD